MRCIACNEPTEDEYCQQCLDIIHFSESIVPYESTVVWDDGDEQELEDIQYWSSFEDDVYEHGELM